MPVSQKPRKQLSKVLQAKGLERLTSRQNGGRKILAFLARPEGSKVDYSKRAQGTFIEQQGL